MIRYRIKHTFLGMTSGRLGSWSARQGKTGCAGRTIKMDRLDHLVADHLETRLLDPERLADMLTSHLDRREEQDARRRTQAAELNRRAAEAEARLKRLYAAIESGVADLDDPSLKERIDELKATRDQARIDAERSKAAVENAGQIITATQLEKFAQAARRRMRGSDGGCRRDHLRALAQRVEVSEREVRIMGSKNTLLRVLAASNGVESAANDVRIYVPEWRRGWDSNPARSARSIESRGFETHHPDGWEQTGYGGEGGIRTHEAVSHPHAFQACALSHSATSP